MIDGGKGGLKECNDRKLGHDGWDEQGKLGFSAGSSFLVTSGKDRTLVSKSMIKCPRRLRDAISHSWRWNTHAPISYPGSTFVSTYYDSSLCHFKPGALVEIDLQIVHEKGPFDVLLLP